MCRRQYVGHRPARRRCRPIGTPQASCRPLRCDHVFAEGIAVGVVRARTGHQFVSHAIDGDGVLVGYGILVAFGGDFNESQFTFGDVDTLSPEMGQHMGMDPQMYDQYVHKLVVPASSLEGHFSTYFPYTGRDNICIFELR